VSSPDLARRPQLAPHVRLKIDAVSGDPVLLYPEGILVLNSTAHEIVRRCDGELTIAELIQRLGAEFEADEAVLRHDVVENLEYLHQRNLLLYPA
jgi:pyrroloquinoline quinone biosynthesis protein D